MGVSWMGIGLAIVGFVAIVVVLVLVGVGMASSLKHKDGDS